MNMKNRLLSFIILSLLLIPAVAQAAGSVIINPLKYDTFEEIAENITHYIFIIAIVLAPLLILIGAFLILISGGAALFQLGKNIILWSIIGLVIVLMGRGLISLFKYLVGATDGDGGALTPDDCPEGWIWNGVTCCDAGGLCLE